MDRKQFLRATALGAGSLALGPVTSWLDGAEPTPVPARIGQTEIEHIHTAARVFENWGYTYGGGPVREAVHAQLRYSAGLLDATVPARLRTELFAAVGDLANVAGFTAFDACAHDEAKRMFRFALACAEEARRSAKLTTCASASTPCWSLPDYRPFSLNPPLDIPLFLGSRRSNSGAQLMP